MYECVAHQQPHMFIYQSCIQVYTAAIKLKANIETANRWKNIQPSLPINVIDALGLNIYTLQYTIYFI